MNEYIEKAKSFLKSANAEMKIAFIGTEVNSRWNDTEPRNKYRFTITTPKGKMEGVFWDSIYSTRKNSKESLTEYDILACLEKYDVGTMDDFMAEFGYLIKSATDMSNFIFTYNAVQKEYRDLCRIFTEAQMEELREIQ